MGKYESISTLDGDMLDHATYRDSMDNVPLVSEESFPTINVSTSSERRDDYFESKRRNIFGRDKSVTYKVTNIGND